MTAPGKQTSRWGSFLQQAVAGVESKLDDILAEPDDNARKEKLTPAPTTTATTKSDSISRSASPCSKPNDRLQDRLARAIAIKNAGQKADARGPQSSAISRTSSPQPFTEIPRRSTDGVSSGTGRPTAGAMTLLDQDACETAVPSTEQLPTTAAQLDESGILDGNDSQDIPYEAQRKQDSNASPRISIDSNRSGIPRTSTESSRKEIQAQHAMIDATALGKLESKSTAEYEALVSQLRSDLEMSELQRQEEVHGYVERIDGLQAKLQYLAKESAEAAKRTSSSASSGTLEKKVAEKEAQIGLLMEEGQQLSKKERTHMSTIKKLRAKTEEDKAEIAQAVAKQEKAEKETATIKERWKRSESLEKHLQDKSHHVNQLQKEVNRLKVEKDAQDATIQGLKTQLEDAVARDKQAEMKVASEALKTERRRVADLEEDLGNLNIEKNLVGDRTQAQIKDLKEKLDKEIERSRIASMEMKTEQQMLESRLEVMRARAEEVSSGATGDAQAKLLRQIETLQTQYAVASENWQGIESSLVAKATSMEKERDDTARREADLRRKARETTMKAKRHEEELDETKSKLPSFQQELAEHKAQLDSLKKRAEAAESALIEAKSSFEKEKQAWKSEMQQRLEEERLKWNEETSGHSSLGHSRAESPVLATRKGLTTEFLGLQGLQIRRPTTRSTNNDAATGERFMGRRPSTQFHGRSSGQATPPRQDSTTSFPSNGEVPETPSIHHIDQDEFFENHRSASPQQTINDMASASTAAAGPSVQLVERMSSAVRRLESEKVATKEDIARLISQRDEARAEIVALMKEVEAKRSADSKVAELENEMKDINGRYQTTLEMLGEKSELVEELRSDIDDIKAMYRELVERTVK